MRFEYTGVYNFKNALRGMRNAKNSWSRIDSVFHHGFEYNPNLESEKNFIEYNNGEDYICIGPNDLELAKSLIKSGPAHRKFMRQIFVSVDITAPLFWWKEADTYKVSTTANSTSTMHKLTSKPIYMHDFEMDDFNYLEEMNPDGGRPIPTILNNFIIFLEILRVKYLQTKEKKYWKELIRMLPESYLQKRTWSCTYETLLGICAKDSRRNHKLNEWSGKDNPNLPNFIAWARRLPYAHEFLFLDETDEEFNEALKINPFDPVYNNIWDAWLVRTQDGDITYNEQLEQESKRVTVNNEKVVLNFEDKL